MLLRLLLSVFLSSSVIGQQGNDDIIQWSSNRKLSWNDFQAAPPKDASNAALTSSGILMKFKSDGESLFFEIDCNFVKKSSWGRVKNDHILSHEQGHFDITEIHARKLNKALKAYRYNQNSVSKDVNGIYQEVMEELRQTQNLYDDETDYSRNLAQQKTWMEKIDHLLLGLKDYSGYEHISK